MRFGFLQREPRYRPFWLAAVIWLVAGSKTSVTCCDASSSAKPPLPDHAPSIAVVAPARDEAAKMCAS